jgi:hypothetical protein
VTDDLRWPREAWLPLLAGLLWLWHAPSHGLAGFLFSVLPGCLLLSSGVAMLLMPGDRRIAQFAGLGGALGVVFALPAFVAVGPGAALLLIAASVAGYLGAGLHSSRLEPRVDAVPQPEPTLRLAAEVAADEALLATMFLSARYTGAGDHERISLEVAQTCARFEAEGWLGKPAAYHETPPALTDPQLRPARLRALHFEHLSFESGYAPRDGEAGRERWLERSANRTAHAWLLRHRGAPRPWLVCIHGYQMGWPLIDWYAFDPRVFHHQLGMNLLVPTLPLHGLRKAGRRSGDGYLSGDPIEALHAVAQAMWDLRRMIGWLREEQAAPAVGVMGLSLGGYNAAVLASLEDSLACAIAGIPVTDFSRIYYRHLPPHVLDSAASCGVEERGLCNVLSVVSPLCLEPRVPRERRYLFGGTADRLVPPDQLRDLWRHWQEPRIQWYPGAHITFGLHPQVRAFVIDALRESGLAA